MPRGAAQSARSCWTEQGTENGLGDAREIFVSRESTVIRHRFGFRSSGGHSLRKVSARMGLSQEGVRRIEQRALNKLRRPHIRRMISGLA